MVKGSGSSNDVPALFLWVGEKEVGRSYDRVNLNALKFIEKGG